MTRHLLNAMASLRRRSEGVGQQSVQALEELQKMFQNPERRGIRIISRLIEQIHREETRIGEECLKIQALFQPAGQALRTLSAHSKCSACWERIAARAQNISYLMRDLKTRQGYQFPPPAFEMARRMTHLASKSVQALTEEDLIEAKAICMGDPILMELKKLVEHACISGLEEADLPFAEKVKVIRVILEYEFTEDILCCIAGETVYLVNGEVMRSQRDLTALSPGSVDDPPEVHEVPLKESERNRKPY
jgi:phosphate transport system protein